MEVLTAVPQVFAIMALVALRERVSRVAEEAMKLSPG
jgi:hypothetical protein